MKKRVKLFSTIASLCLAVALMAFGVLAATTETFKVTSTVSYSVTGQVNAEFTVKVTYKTQGVTVGGENNTKATNTDTESTAGFTTLTWTQARVPGDSQNEISLTLGDYTFNANALKDDTIVYEITIENKANESLSVELTNFLTTSATNSNDAITLTVEDSSFSVVEGENTKKKATASALGSVTYKVTYKLSEPTKNATTLTFNPNFSVTVVNS